MTSGAAPRSAGSEPPGIFAARVLAVVRQIPKGRVATYGDIATWAGRPRAWRAVGTIMRTCRSPSVPCHRVVAAGGRVGGYSDPLRKRRLLQNEGIVVGARRIRQFETVRWTPSDGLV
ncbi:MAG: MGMT family protein [Acidobacteriota bacterium]|nr:MGMT family protein [Acidobacteriota bacterium]